MYADHPLFERFLYLSCFLEEEDVGEWYGFIEGSSIAVGVITFTHHTSGWSWKEKVNFELILPKYLLLKIDIFPFFAVKLGRFVVYVLFCDFTNTSA
jgi:hypothetical protein